MLKHRLSTEVARLFPLQGQWSESDYLSLPDTNHLVELSNGRLVVLDLPSYAHQFAVGEFFAALRQFVRDHHLGHVALAPLRVRLWPGKFREPDLVFLSTAHEDRRGEDYWGPPDLAVEVLSPRSDHSSGTEKTDRVDKFDEYAQAGVLEYWLVDPVNKAIEVYSLQAGAYRLHGRWNQQDMADSVLLNGFRLQVADLFQV